MKLKPHGLALVNFVIDFVNGDMERMFFDMDYSHYVIEHFPYFEKEHPQLAKRFADTVDAAYDMGQNLSDEDLRYSLSEALDVFMGNDGDCDLI